MMPYTQAMPGNSLDWLWHWLGYAVALVSLGVVVWALFWDRARGRQRCRTCFYDLSDASEPTPESPVTCPECGKAHTKPKQFLKTRRRLRWAGVGALAMVVGGYGLWVVPRVQSRGWIGAVPTLVLAASISRERWRGGAAESRFEMQMQPALLLLDREDVVREELMNMDARSRWNIQEFCGRRHNWLSSMVVRLRLRFDSVLDGEDTHYVSSDNEYRALQSLRFQVLDSVFGKSMVNHYRDLVFTQYGHTTVFFGSKTCVDALRRAISSDPRLGSR